MAIPFSLKCAYKVLDLRLLPKCRTVFMASMACRAHQLWGSSTDWCKQMVVSLWSRVSMGQCLHVIFFLANVRIIVCFWVWEQMTSFSCVLCCDKNAAFDHRMISKLRVGWWIWAFFLWPADEFCAFSFWNRSPGDKSENPMVQLFYGTFLTEGVHEGEWRFW